MKAIIPAIVWVLGLCGCATPPVKQVEQFNPAHFTRYDKPGTAQISGEAFLRTKGGDVKTAAGRRIYLVPLVPYTDERAKIMWERKEPEAPDPRLARYTKSTTADAQGRFSFSSLPAGSYLVYTTITWTVSDGSETGGAALGRVLRLGEGEKKPVVVTR